MKEHSIWSPAQFSQLSLVTVQEYFINVMHSCPYFDQEQ